MPKKICSRNMPYHLPLVWLTEKNLFILRAGCPDNLHKIFNAPCASNSNYVALFTKIKLIPCPRAGDMLIYVTSAEVKQVSSLPFRISFWCDIFSTFLTKIHSRIYIRHGNKNYKPITIGLIIIQFVFDMI